MGTPNDAMDPPFNRYEAAALFFIARWHTLADTTYTIEQAMKQAEFSDLYSQNATLQERVRRIVLKKLPAETSSGNKDLATAKVAVVPVSFVETNSENSSPMSQITEPSPRSASTKHSSYFHVSPTRFNDELSQRRCHKHSKTHQAGSGKENHRDEVRKSDPSSEKVRRHKLAMKTLVSGGQRKAERTQTMNSRLLTEESPPAPNIMY